MGRVCLQYGQSMATTCQVLAITLGTPCHHLAKREWAAYKIGCGGGSLASASILHTIL